MSFVLSSRPVLKGCLHVAALICLATQLNAQESFPRVQEGPVFNPANGHQYYLLDLSTWEQAEARAVQLGGHLVSINDAAENLWVYGTFGLNSGSPRALWIGLRDPQRQSTPGLAAAQRAQRFAWVNGEPVTFSNWWAGRPNNAGTEGDGTGSQFWTYVRSDLLWDDVDNGLNFIQGVVEVASATPSRNRVVGWGEGLTEAKVPPTSTRGAVSIGAGSGFGVALLGNGGVVVWPPTAPQPPAGLGPVAQIAVGASHIVARLRDGTVRAWGDNSEGQAAVPAGLTGIVAVTAGFYHSMAIDAAGKLARWGAAPPGPPTAPQLVGTWRLGAGFDESYALKVDGTLLAWGPGPGVKQLPPGLPPLRWIRGGHVHAIAQAVDGRILSWGGFGPADFALPNFAAPVAAAMTSLLEAFSVAVLGNGNVVPWGDTSAFPGLTAPPSLTGILDLAIGGDVAFALLPPPAGDSFAEAVPITGDFSAGGSKTLPGDNTEATREEGEPVHGLALSGASVWWKWTPPRRGVVTLNLNGLSQGASHQLAAYVAPSGANSFSALTPRRRATPDGFGRFFPSSFLAEATETVWIAVEGIFDGEIPAEGTFQLLFDFEPAAFNDAFNGAAPIQSTGGLPTTGSLLGTGRDPLEPNLGAGVGWWVWTASPNLGPGGARTTVAVTGNQNLLGLRIYQGAANSLTEPPTDLGVVGLTTQASFDAVAGRSYYIAVGGLPFDELGLVGNRVFTRVRLDVVSSPLAIYSADIQTESNPADRTAVLSGSVVVKNLSSERSGEVRLALYRRPGFALIGSTENPGNDADFTELAGIVPVTVNGIAAGERVTVPVRLTLPAADGRLFFGDVGRGWGGFAVLEERAATKSGVPRWRAIHRRLLGTGLWPFFNLDNVGPGGGAIRVDPAANTPALAVVELTSVSVVGPDELAGGAMATFAASALWSDGAQEGIDPDWQVEAPARISPAGVLNTADITQTTGLSVRASYSSGGMEIVGTKTVAVSVIPLQWDPPRLVNGGFALTLRGRPGQRVRIERSPDLRDWKSDGERSITAAGTVDVPWVPVAGRAAEFLRAVVLP